MPNTGITDLVAKAGELTDESFIRKVDTFNEAYRMQEKGAILNWFDITEPEGFYNLNCKMGDLAKSQAAMGVFGGFLMPLMPQKEGGGAAFTPDLMAMLGSFTVLRLINLLGMMLTQKLTKEQLLDLNAKLNAIPLA